MTASISIFVALFIIKALYALLLEWKFRKLEPDDTWGLVLIGVALCIIAAGIDRRLNGPFTADQTEARIIFALLWGGIPIGVWQVWKKQRAARRIFQRIFKGVGTADGNQSDRPAALAEERAMGTERDD